MSVTLDLPEEFESELATEAARLGLPLPEYILRLISTARSAGNKPKTGAELVEYWETEGLIGARPDIADSQTHGLARFINRHLRDWFVCDALHVQRQTLSGDSWAAAGVAIHVLSR